MNDLEFTFEEAGFDSWLNEVVPGQRIGASQLLMLTESADDAQMEDLFAQLRDKAVVLDISDLTKPALSGEIVQRLRLEEQLAQQGLAPEKMEPTDPLRLYLEELAAIPACGDMASVAEQLREANRQGIAADTLQNRMVNLALCRVVEMAQRYTGYGVLLLDLIQEGSMGLWLSLATYTDGAPEAFVDDVVSWYMKKAVVLYAHAAGTGQKLRRAAEDYRAVDEQLLGELGRNPTVEEIAQRLHMSAEETAAVAEILENVRTLNRAVKPQAEELPQEDQAVEDTAYFQMRQRIAELLSRLSDEDAQLLTLRYGLEGGAPLTAAQTAARLGIMPDAVTEREAAALAKLRQQN